MKFSSAFAALSMTVALAACGELPFQQASDPAAQGHVGPPGVSPLEQPIETGAPSRAVATAEATTMNTAIFRASGSGWTVSAADKTAVYERPGRSSVGVTVRRMTYASGVEFIGMMNGTLFSLNIRAAACETAGERLPFTAQLRVGSQRLSGCAGPAEALPRPDTRASSSPPAPKSQPKPAAPQPKPAETAPAETPAETPAPATPAEPAPAPAAPAANTGADAAAETAAETVAPAATPPAETAPATTAPAATAPTGNGVPAPQIVLPPTPPTAGDQPSSAGE
ncbi:hypothetical protein SAMN04487972_10882 [Paracoccus halophilus]|uniref:Uncharacterized protein n=1 Tax=Paracoccus halophilus TaxID=376733 RepID=A0A1I0THH9_9RHOB|nr:hypothetical protein [Paracoccus halophilus]SFA51214.1 hypothetical protein SAMN04487972_10882 [Paracoccus halophilus]